MSQPRINIPAIFEAVVAKVASNLKRDVYFDFGKLKEIVRRLTTKGMANNGKKYPLVWLVMNYAESYGETEEFCELKDITIMICNLTQPELSTADRISKYFEPILYPIYEELINQLGESGFFSYTGTLGYKHQKIDCPYWNEDMKAGDNNQFSDFIDAIQIRNLGLIVNEQTCNRFRLIGYKPAEQAA